MIRNNVPEQDSVKIEVDPYTARMLKLQYDSIKKPLGFDSLGEFLLSAGRKYMFPLTHLIPKDQANEIHILQDIEASQPDPMKLEVEFPQNIYKALELAAQLYNQEISECALALIAMRLDRLSQTGQFNEHSESIKNMLRSRSGS